MIEELPWIYGFKPLANAALKLCGIKNKNLASARNYLFLRYYHILLNGLVWYAMVGV